MTVPIGNLADISLRVLEALKDGQYFFCEDTRAFKSLLNHYEISLVSKHIDSFHDHSSPAVTEKIVELLNNGVSVYYASEAGSAMISDPGYPLLKKVIEKGFDYDVFGGISSVVNALEKSGLAPIPFHFHGFLPKKEGEVLKLFNEAFLTSYGTHIFFLGSSKILAILEQLKVHFPNIDVVVCRELTKKFESIYRFRAGEFNIDSVNIDERGEFVLLCYISLKNENFSKNEAKNLALEVLSSKGHPKSVAKLVSLLLNKPTKEIYQQFVKTE